MLAFSLCLNKSLAKFVHVLDEYLVYTLLPHIHITSQIRIRSGLLVGYILALLGGVSHGREAHQWHNAGALLHCLAVRLDKQVAALTGRNRTVLPCSISRRIAHAPSGRQRYRRRQTTDDSDRRQRAKNTGPLGGLVTSLQQCCRLLAAVNSFSNNFPLNPVHTSNNVEATFDFVAKNGNNAERVYRKISFFFPDKIVCCFDIVAGVDGA